ncbi:hypothetical protein [Sulfurimonas sp. NW9]|uniref:hypothetical protein n=1 Tax=Sulfurimonas sp. NW9 TaxID=2922728 RepID=UPI003DA7EF7F
MNRYMYSFILLVFALSFFAFGWVSHTAYVPYEKEQEQTLLDTIRENKTLNVVLLNAPSTYYIGPDGPQGFEYDLLQSYAEHLGVDLNYNSTYCQRSDSTLQKSKYSYHICIFVKNTTQRKKISLWTFVF